MSEHTFTIRLLRHPRHPRHSILRHRHRYCLIQIREPSTLR